jgi:hypothetical protein
MMNLSECEPSKSSPGTPTVPQYHYSIATRTLFDSDLTGATFNSAEGWTAVWAENTNQITMCGSYQLFGGYGVFGRYATISKTFTGLPPHYAIQVSFILMKIDSWDNEQFFLYVDGTIASQKQYMYDQGT